MEFSFKILCDDKVFPSVINIYLKVTIKYR